MHIQEAYPIYVQTFSEVIKMDILLIKLVASLLSGFLIGVDRQIKHKPLGLKTSMVICIASCLMTIVSIEAVAKYASDHTPNMNPNATCCSSGKWCRLPWRWCYITKKQ